MLSNDPAESQTAQPSAAKYGTAGVPAAVMNPRDTVEVASAGTTPVYDPPGMDEKPPGAVIDFDLFA